MGGNIIGLHQLIIASGHKLGHGAALRGRTRAHFTKWNAHTVERGGFLDARRPARQATGTNYDESILICRKGQYLKLVPSRHSGAAGEAGEQRGTGGDRLVFTHVPMGYVGESGGGQGMLMCTICQDVRVDEVQIEKSHTASAYREGRAMPHRRL